MHQDITVIGGGLAGCEAAWQAAKAGCKVTLFEMRPVKTTDAHKTDHLAELVCSNSLKSDSPLNAHGLLKKELEVLDSLIINTAKEAKIPGGSALVVDRMKFSGGITAAISGHPNITVIRKEVTDIPDGICIIATGPLTSPELSVKIADLLGSSHLFFYDAISPIIDAESIDYEKVFFASRYNKGGNDYLNCPMDKEEYDKFVEELIKAEKTSLRDFEKNMFYEGCLPVEEIASRGKLALAYGPMKPIGIIDPKTGRMPFAVVQLRLENIEKTMYNIVGFQSRMKISEQERVFRMIPGLEKCEFQRLGSVHRNTYINSPHLLNNCMQVTAKPQIFFAGQITGSEGYTEAAATGAIAGINANNFLKNKELSVPDEDTIIGSLCRYLSGKKQGDFQPMNANFGLLKPLLYKIKDKSKKAEEYFKKSEISIKKWTLSLAC